MANNERRNAADYVIAGGTLLGASAAADGAVAYDRKVRGMDGPIRAATKRKFTRRHAGQVGVKLGGRAAFAAGAPLAAYGGYKMVRPDGPVPKLDAKRDVVKPVTRGVTLKDLADEQERRFRKADNLTRKETNTLVTRKKRGQHISTAAGVMGLGALALRAPEAAKFATKRSAKAGKNAALKRLVSREPSATKASNALGIVSIGTGAAGSLNYAAQQKLEAKQIKKGLYDGVVRGIGRVRVVERTKPGYVTVYDAKDTKRFMPESRVTPVPKRGKKKAKLVPVDKPSPVQGQQLELFKADRFLNQYGDRISPKAEEGYKYLKRGRNRRIADAGVSAGFAGLSGGVGLHALKRGSKGWAAVGAAGAALSGVSAARSGNDAARWNSKLGKIKAKAKEREAAGKYGRPVSKAEFSRNEKQGAAMIAGGAGALAAGLSSGRAVSAYEQSRISRIDRKIARAPKAERNKVASQLGAKRKKILSKKRGFKTRAGMLVAGYSVATPLVWAGGRKFVEKADKHDVDAFMGGALAGAGAYQGAGYMTQLTGWEKRNYARFPDRAKKVIASHDRKTLRPNGERSNPPKGHPAWKKHGRTYPKTDAVMRVGRMEIPAHKYKRVMSRLQGGKTQVAITAGAAGAAGLGAAALNRKVRPVSEREVAKSRAKRFARLIPTTKGVDNAARQQRDAARRAKKYSPNLEAARRKAEAASEAGYQRSFRESKKLRLKSLAAGAGYGAAAGAAGTAVIRRDEMSKSFGLARSAFMPRSTGIRAPRIRKPAIRRSYIARSASGKKFTVRGSLK